ncbi:NAD(P)H-hydrate dehydratase [Methylomonas koyamae]|uniref:NAD(P)H-hydrate dehydratase n=1 Tax=Methylomonas koyamae TaxID=702114 RepID=UPI001126338E|nr:NAD(P)H-hydrate dehydratase [Methylomonas koyamae]TPQ26407.1 bifunctional ADP-dependent NAD(P)H-hydrate dehydratase/NAD(P)H-hydrate epimerase [Methylomonas koyamae]
MQISTEALYSTAQIRSAESWAIEGLGIPGRELMQRAGSALFRQIRQRWPDCGQLTVFCGGGNNGGDGYEVARLAHQAGYRVAVYSLADPDKLPADASGAYRDFLQAGGCVSDFEPGLSEIEGVVVDALFGIGLSRDVAAAYLPAIAAINAAGGPVLAVDVPSGLQADTGCILGAAVVADLTVTFIGPKQGLYTGAAADCRGEVVCADLEIGTLLVGVEPASLLLKNIGMPKRQRSAHKGQFGHVLLIGGNHGYSGAIRLAAESALRAGAGLVSVATRAAHSAWVNIARPELMCRAAEQVGDLEQMLDKADVVVVGPGLGRDAWAQAMFDGAVAAGKPCVVDADGLNLLALGNSRRDNWVLTPHPGEAARLLNCDTRQVGSDRFAAVSALQQRYGGVALLKGAGTLIGDGSKHYVVAAGNPGMASGGMGDVLAGLIGGLIAQGFSLDKAALAGAQIHAAAADSLAAEFGERGLLAGDLPPRIRELLNR